MPDIDLTKVTHNHIINGAAITFGMLIAPLWFIYQFQPDLYFTTDFWKLIFIALGISFPLQVLLFGQILLFCYISKDPLLTLQMKVVIEATFTVGAFATAMVLYTPSVTKYGTHITVNEAIYECKICLYSMAIFTIGGGFITRWIRNGKAKKP